MRALLLGLAAPIAAVTLAAPAAALDPVAPVITAGSAAGVRVHHGLPPQFQGGHHADRPRGDGDHRRRRRGDTVIFYDRDYQGDTAWRANSYNDWWHERTERSFPRWVSNNQGCERMWWSGGGWRC